MWKKGDKTAWEVNKLMEVNEYQEEKNRGKGEGGEATAKLIMNFI